MNNKKILIAIFVLIVILAVAIFAFKSCEPRKKVLTSEEEEYSAFINANVEFTCELVKNTELADVEIAQEKLKESYEKYKFPIEDDTKMLVILEKYENNLEVTEIIKNNSEPCLEGGNPILHQYEENN